MSGGVTVRLLTRYVLFFLAVPALSTVQAADTLRIGEYLSEKYISILKTTHSPKQAETVAPFAMYARVSASAVAGASYELRIGNFHEGYGPINIKRDGEILKDEASRESGMAGAKCQILSKESFRIYVKDEQPVKFIYIGDVGRFVSSQTVAGEYEDSAGRSISLRLDGVATFPSKSYTYRVNTDFFGPPDYECIFLDDVPFAYVRSKDSLSLYATSGEESMTIASRPSWVLKKKRHA
jgi:hypothetical protein